MRALMDQWQTWAIFSALFAAATALLGRAGAMRVDADFATLIRVIVVLGMTALIVAARKSAPPLSAVKPETWIFLALSGLATGLSWLCYFRALQLGPASRVAPVDKLSVVFVAVLAVLFLGEKLPPLGWLGVAFITVGAVLLSLA